MNSILKPKVFVAMSGGVDSSVAALLLKERGFDITGIFMKNWTDESVLRHRCSSWEEERADALKVALKLGIKFETWNFEKEYKNRVMEYFFREYEAGRTPNPDIMCNREIKFGVFLKKALARGADYVATGHYAKIIEDKNGFHLATSKDKFKDQTYFLSAIKKEHLNKIIFPIGDYEKSDVRKLAKKFNLSVADKKDSQGICFVGDVDIKTFLKKRIKGSPGPIITTEGEVVGTHEGVAFYTIGQRKGLGVGGGLPFYVLKKDKKTNALIVAKGNSNGALYQKQVILENLNWLAKISKLKFPISAWARIRYLQKLVRADVELTRGNAGDKIRLNFSEPIRAVTPGQIGVIYQEFQGGFEVLGGGVIV